MIQSFGSDGIVRPPLSARPAHLLRVNWLLCGGVALPPMLIVALVQPLHLPGALLAYANLVIIGSASAYFVSQRTLQGLIPAIFLTWLAAAWPLGSLYFAIFAPEWRYSTLAGDREFLFGDTRLQLTTTAFLLSYLGVMVLLQGRRLPWRAGTGTPRTDRRAATIVLWISMVAITFNAVSKVRPFPDALQYIADGGYQYLHSLTLMVGVLFTSLTMRTRLISALFLVLAGVFYTIGNARGMAALPIALFLVGLIFLSNLDKRWKTWIVTTAVICFPLALVISNTTRLVTRTIGFQNLSSRLGALNQWQEVLARTPVLVSTFGRLFFIGGHTIITLSPEFYPYVPFSTSRYTQEFAMRMLPRRVLKELYYSEQPNRILRNYGFLITDETSIPLSLIGSLYMLGGIVPVVVGAAGLGVFHSLVGFGLRLAQRRSRHLALFVFAMIAAELLWGQNRDLISHVRSIVWNGGAAVLIFEGIVRPLLGRAPPVQSRVQRLAARAT